MDVKPLTREQIATTERKLSMPLDDIIKMSKNTTTKNKKPHRVVNKSQTVFNHGAQNKALKMQHYMDSRPIVRQGALAQRRSNFQRNQFPIITEAPRKAAVAPFGRKPFGRNMVPNTNTRRTGTFVAQRRAVNAGFARKSPQEPSSPLSTLLKSVAHCVLREDHQMNDISFGGGGLSTNCKCHSYRRKNNDTEVSIILAANFEKNNKTIFNEQY